jgi:aromatic-L-amino-acid/L-tryptophan decarboxylase
VSASGGATNTGAVDPLVAIADVCRERGVWLHVDAAYGGFAALTQRGADALAGIERADSITLDPHKWLFQPYECGCVLVRDGDALAAAFAMTPEYLRDTRAHGGEVNFADRGIQLTRSARALKVWLSLRTLGLRAFRSAIDRALDLAEYAADRIERSETLELAAPPSLGIVCFGRRFPAAREDDEQADLNARLVAALEATGLAMISSTRLRGRYAMRMCVLNPATSRAEVEQTLAFLESADVERERRVAQREYPLHPAAAQTWPAAIPGVATGPHPDPASLRELSLFASLSPGEAAGAAALAVIREVEAGETIIEQWDVARDFFVLLAGAVEVLVDDRRARVLHRGDMFGEIAAIEWARGYGYPRTASVIATEPSRLAMFREGAVNELIRQLPEVRKRVLATMHERLPSY